MMREFNIDSVQWCAPTAIIIGTVVGHTSRSVTESRYVEQHLAWVDSSISLLGSWFLVLGL